MGEDIRKKKKGNNNHHIVPRSRCKEFGIDQEDEDAEWNQVAVDIHDHELYHALFGNKTPREVFDFLSKTFWKGMIKMPKEEYEQLFKNIVNGRPE